MLDNSLAHGERCTNRGVVRRGRRSRRGDARSCFFLRVPAPSRRPGGRRLGDGPLLFPGPPPLSSFPGRPFPRHIQVLVRAGLVQQQRTGRISRCSLLAGPIFAVAVWINRYSKYWQEQFDMLAAMLGEVSEPPRPKRRAARRKTTGRKV